MTRAFATLEQTVTEQPKKERTKSELLEQKSTMLTAQVLWGCRAYNATPEQACSKPEPSLKAVPEILKF